MRKTFLLSLIVLSCLLMSGCASLTMLSKNRKTKVRTVKIDGFPSDAKVFLNNEYVANSPCDVYVKRMYRRNRIRIEKTNYTTKEFKVKKKIRGFWLASDIFPGVIVLGVPLVIDFANASILKVDPQIKFQLSYTDDFYRKEFNNIRNSNNPEDFKSYMTKYPESICKDLAIVKVDSLDFIRALNKKSDLALGEYINSHPSSKFNTEAQEIKNDLFNARMAFESATKKNTASAYLEFVTKFPKSFYFEDAKEKLVNTGEKEAFGLTSSQAISDYIINILNKYATYGRSREVKNNKALEELQNRIIKENISSTISNYDNFINLWKNTYQYEKKHGQLKKIREIYIPKIYDELFVKLCQTKTKEEQHTLYEKSKNDFPDLVRIDETNPSIDFIDDSKKKTGVVKLYQNSYFYGKSYSKYHKNDLEKDIVALVDKVNEPYNREITFWNNVGNSSYYEEITFLSNNLNGTQRAYIGKIPIFTIDYSNGELYGKATLYEKGKVIKIYSFSNGKMEYYYDFKDGINLSLKQLDDKIKSGEKAFNSKDYDEALRIYQNDCKNNYPSDVVQNKKVYANIEKILKIKTEIAKKEEEARIIQRQKEIKKNQIIENQKNDEENKRRLNKTNSSSSFSSNSDVCIYLKNKKWAVNPDDPGYIEFMCTGFIFGMMINGEMATGGLKTEVISSTIALLEVYLSESGKTYVIRVNSSNNTLLIGTTRYILKNH